MAQLGIRVPKKELAEFCQRNNIVRLSFFGSVLNDSFGPNSDIDVLVEFAPGHTPGYDYIRIQDDLSQLLGGRPVDMLTPKFLNKHIREKVLMEAVLQYAQR